MSETTFEGRTAFFQQEAQAEITAKTLQEGLEGANSPEKKTQERAKKGLRAVKEELRENPGQIPVVRKMLNKL